MWTLKCKGLHAPLLPLLPNPATVASSPETTTHLQKQGRQTTVLTKPLYLYLLSTTHTKHILVTYVLKKDSHLHSTVSLLLVAVQDMRICRNINTCLSCVIRNACRTNWRLWCTAVWIVDELSLGRLKPKLSDKTPHVLLIKLLL
jgi:hypothetical protein